MKKAGNSNSIIKRANEHLILGVLRRNDSASVEDIVSATRLSRPTVLHILKDLDAKGLACKAGLGESLGGRQPVLYQLDLSNHFAVGIDFEYTPLRVAISDLKENLLFSRVWVSERTKTIDEIVADLVKAVQEGMEALSITTENLIGVGLGIPGRVDIVNNQATDMGRMQQWNSEDIPGMVAKALKVSVIVRNDIHLMAAYERRLQPQLPRSFFYVARRKGIGGAVFIQNHIYEGNSGNSAFMGHIVMEPDGPACRCGKHGCLEVFTSVPQLESRYAERKNLKTPVPYPEILARARSGDLPAAQIIGDAVEKLAMVISAGVQMYDIQAVVFCDEHQDEDDYFFNLVDARLKELTTCNESSPVCLYKSLLNSDTYALGGCAQILDSFFKAPKLKV